MNPNGPKSAVNHDLVCHQSHDLDRPYMAATMSCKSLVISGIYLAKNVQILHKARGSLQMDRFKSKSPNRTILRSVFLCGQKVASGGTYVNISYMLIHTKWLWINMLIKTLHWNGQTKAQCCKFVCSQYQTVLTECKLAPRQREGVLTIP